MAASVAGVGSMGSRDYSCLNMKRCPSTSGLTGSRWLARQSSCSW
jgi:hypothetical protein